MSNKPNIYATCKAGCKWETVHKSDFEQSAAVVRLYNTNGTYSLSRYKRYNILVDEDGDVGEIQMRVTIQAKDGDTVLSTITTAPIAFPSSDETKTLKFKMGGFSAVTEVGQTSREVKTFLDYYYNIGVKYTTDGYLDAFTRDDIEIVMSLGSWGGDIENLTFEIVDISVTNVSGVYEHNEGVVSTVVWEMDDYYNKSEIDNKVIYGSVTLSPTNLEQDVHFGDGTKYVRMVCTSSTGYGNIMGLESDLGNLMSIENPQVGDTIEIINGNLIYTQVSSNKASVSKATLGVTFYTETWASGNGSIVFDYRMEK